ncbi:hypothetical protein L6164_021324 [Bauhinia variegata]|uniref:Uncharacterized protein n=1 Tax=Bauhinia variegata TaxID=167791 RepID=A0ACB9MY52_BAUVA|nr:hypothetical protein L6164_021324 [Bauhinia variegata]
MVEIITDFVPAERACAMILQPGINTINMETVVAYCSSMTIKMAKFLQPIDVFSQQARDNDGREEEEGEDYSHGVYFCCSA